MTPDEPSEGRAVLPLERGHGAGRVLVERLERA